MMWEKKIKGLAIAGALSLASVAAAPADADAFCGFYVSGGDAELFNDATQVALMRSGEKTILSMQNNYQGPTKKFAMVVPVPVVLMEDDVKTLPADLFKKIDQLSAPRLVEYWGATRARRDINTTAASSKLRRQPGGAATNVGVASRGRRRGGAELQSASARTRT